MNGPIHGEAELEGLIADETYLRVPDTTCTVCALTLDSGFVVVGKSATISAEYFDADKGREIARKDAVNQLWQFEGYHRKAREAEL